MHEEARSRHPRPAKTVSVIVVSFNTKTLTLQCLESLISSLSGISAEVIVVDNASDDGSPELIARQFEQIAFIPLDRNIGFAAANNLAAARAVGEHLLLLNPDTIVGPAAMTALIDFARERPEIGIYGGRTIFPDGSLNPTSCWARPTPWSLFCYASGLNNLLSQSRLLNPEAYGSWPRDSNRHVDIVTGCFFMIRRRLWEQLGGFDPDFFLSGEEADLCLRAKRLGYRPMVCAAAEIVHYSGQSFGSNADRNAWFLYGRQLLIEKHWPPFWVPYARGMHKLWVLRRLAAWRVLSAAGRTNARDRLAETQAIWARRGQWSHPARGRRPMATQPAESGS